MNYDLKLVDYTEALDEEADNVISNEMIANTYAGLSLINVAAPTVPMFNRD